MLAPMFPFKFYSSGFILCFLSLSKTPCSACRAEHSPSSRTVFWPPWTNPHSLSGAYNVLPLWASFSLPFLCSSSPPANNHCLKSSSPTPDITESTCVAGCNLICLTVLDLHLSPSLSTFLPLLVIIYVHVFLTYSFIFVFF